MSEIQEKTKVVIPLGAFIIAFLSFAAPWAIYVTVSLFQVREDVAVIKATVVRESAHGLASNEK